MSRYYQLLELCIALAGVDHVISEREKIADEIWQSAFDNVLEGVDEMIIELVADIAAPLDTVVLIEHHHTNDYWYEYRDRIY